MLLDLASEWTGSPHGGASRCGGGITMGCPGQNHASYCDLLPSR